MLNVYEELGETSRRQILSELRSGSKNVTQLVEGTKLKQPNISNHLARMRAKGIVRASKVGRQVYYSLATPEVEAVVHAVFSMNDQQSTAPNFDETAKQYAKAAVQGDEQTCSEILDAAFRAHVSMLDIYQDLLAPAMTMVGTWYKVEAIDEAQEHMASAITERMMSRTVQITGPAARHGRTAILGCPPNSWHVIGLRMISDYMRLMGWRTLFLGADVPISSFVAAVEQHKPTLVLVSCNAEEGIEEALSLVEKLHQARPHRGGFSIGVGGAAVNQQTERFAAVGADFSARDLRSFASNQLPGLTRTGHVSAEDGWPILEN